MSRVLYCPFIATLGYTGPPDCSLPSFQADHKLSFASHLTGTGVISDSQGTPLDTEHDAEEEKAAQVKRQKAGSPVHQSHSSQYVQGAWGRNFSLSFFVCVCACLRAHVHMCVLLHMCGYMCQSLRPIIMLNCFSTLFIGAGSPNQT